MLDSQEAYIKCLGDGLSMPLDGFRVTPLPSVEAGFMSLGANTVTGSLWTLADIKLSKDYAGAAAYRGEEKRTRLMSITVSGDLL
jgi:phosphopantetheinyl transferase